ncbi:MAG: hypothetical protein ABIO70_06150 [Pseudomonadota bacterium]
MPDPVARSPFVAGRAGGSPRAPWLLPLALAGLVLAGGLAFEAARLPGGFSSAWAAVPLDDAWIHYVYADSLAQHLRLDYNPGQAEAGFTSLLWVAALALPMRLGVGPVLASKLLGLLSLWGVAWVVARWLRPLAGPAIAIAAALLVVLEPLFGFAAVSGMEVVPCALALVAAAAAYTAGRWRLAGLLLAAVVGLRPDGFLLVAGVWALASSERLLPRAFPGPGPRGRDLAWLILPTLALAALWAGYCLLATGQPLPHAYYLRTRGLSESLAPGRLVMLWQMTTDAVPTLDAPWKLAWLALGAGWALRKLGGRGLLIVAFPMVFAVVLGLGVIDILNGTFTGNRYLLPILPFLLGLQALGAAAVVAGVKALLPAGSSLARRLPLLLGPALLLPLLLPPGDLPARWAAARRDFAQSCKNIEDMQAAIGRWVAENTAPDAVIATHDAGAVRYLGERETLDVVGLNTTDRVFSDPAILAREADWLVTFAGRTRHLARAFADREAFRVVLPDNLVCAEDTMVVYRLRAAPADLGKLPEHAIAAGGAAPE